MAPWPSWQHGRNQGLHSRERGGEDMIATKERTDGMWVSQWQPDLQLLRPEILTGLFETKQSHGVPLATVDYDEIELSIPLVAINYMLRTGYVFLLPLVPFFFLHCDERMSSK